MTESSSCRLTAAAFLLSIFATAAPDTFASCPDFWLSSTTMYSIGLGPKAIATGDFNGDGRPDLATVNSPNYDPGTISVLIGNGNGTFMPAVNYALGFGARAITIGDFDGDGLTDLAVAKGSVTPPFGCRVNPSQPGCDMSDSNNLSVLRGNGDGTFGAPRSFAAGQNPADIVAGDVNGDGKSDLLVANENSNDVSVLLARDAMSFTAAAQYPVGNRPLALVTGDFNGDGKRDVAAANADSNNISILAGRGDGTFDGPINIASGGNPRSVRVADLNGDGRPDLIVASGAVKLLTHLATGNLTFGPPVAHSPDALRLGEMFNNVLTVADFDKDGKKDVAIATAFADISIAFGKGDGTFERLANYGVGSEPVGIVSADFDNDGDADLAVAASLDYAAVILNDGTGMFQNNGAGRSPWGVTVGDFDGNGRPDVALANYGSNNMSILSGNGSGSFGPATYYQAGSTPAFVASSDFNRDGILDLALVNSWNRSVSTLRGHGDGTFAPPVAYVLSGASTDLYYLAIADFDGDGSNDLAVATPPSVATLLNRGDGTFASPVYNGSMPGAWSLASADFNRDGKRDLVVTNRPSNVAIIMGRGDGTFDPPVNYSAGSDPWYPAVADFNRDGKDDFAVVNYDSGDVAVFLGNGDGTFSSAVKYAVGQNPRAAVAADLTGDGIADLASANYGSSDVALLVGIGNGAFAPATRFPVTSHPFFLAPSDFDANGKRDLVIVGSGLASVLLNTCSAVASIDSITPDRGPAAGGQGIVIRGNNLSGTSLVLFAAAPGTMTSRVATSVTALTPPGPAGSVDVVVSGTGGTLTAGKYTYVASPLVQLITPTSGDAAGGTRVTIIGVNLKDPTSVMFGGTAAVITASSDTQLTVVSPAHGAGAVDIAVTTAGGTSRYALGFTYRAASAPIPALDEFLLLALGVLLAAASLAKLRN